VLVHDMSCIGIGPQGPAVMALSLSRTGVPAAGVSFFVSRGLTPHGILYRRIFRQSLWKSLHQQAIL